MSVKFHGISHKGRVEISYSTAALTRVISNWRTIYESPKNKKKRSAKVKKFTFDDEEGLSVEWIIESEVTYRINLQFKVDGQGKSEDR